MIIANVIAMFFLLWAPTGFRAVCTASGNPLNPFMRVINKMTRLCVGQTCRSKLVCTIRVVVVVFRQLNFY